MNRSRLPLFFGSLLILVGVVYLLQNLNVVRFNVGQWLWAGLFAVWGVALGGYWLGHRNEWWALIPLSVLTGLAAANVVEALLPEQKDWGGVAFLSCLGLGFWLVFATSRAQWWAIIPGGALLSVAAVVVGQKYVGEVAGGGLLFLGLGLTFAVVALVPNSTATAGTPGKWAWIPAGILAALGLAVFAGALNLFSWLLPLGLIAAGGWWLWRSWRKA